MKKTKNQNFISLLFKIIIKKIPRNLSPRRSCTYSNHYFYYFLLGYLCIIWAMPLSVRNHLVQTRGDRDLRLQSFVSVLWAICFSYFELNWNKKRIKKIFFLFMLIWKPCVLPYIFPILDFSRCENQNWIKIEDKHCPGIHNINIYPRFVYHYYTAKKSIHLNSFLIKKNTAKFCSLNSVHLNFPLRGNATIWIHYS